MKEMNIQFHKTRPQNPFDDGAKARLHRMGLLRIDGSVDEATLNALSRAYSGLLFDDLCDTCQNSCEITEILQRVYEAAEQAEPRQKFLLICLHYDALSQPLPNPIWWISGDSELAGDFAERFICHLKKLSKAMEVTEPCRESYSISQQASPLRSPILLMGLIRGCGKKSSCGCIS